MRTEEDLIVALRIILHQAVDGTPEPVIWELTTPPGPRQESQELRVPPPISEYLGDRRLPKHVPLNGLLLDYPAQFTPTGYLISRWKSRVIMDMCVSNVTTLRSVPRKAHGFNHGMNGDS